MREETIQKQEFLQKVFKRLEMEASTNAPENSTGGVKFSAWKNNWADWDNSGGHNDWDNQAPSPPGGK